MIRVLYPSSVNRGYFSYAVVVLLYLHFISVSILCQSRLFLLHLEVIGTVTPVPGIHPLSIEAISPTGCMKTASRLWLPRIHPLSIEAISPTRFRMCK